MIVLSCNANGLGNDHTKNTLRYYCRTYNPDWFTIYEPKVRFNTIHNSFWRGLNLNFYTENDRVNLRPNIWIFGKTEHIANCSIRNSIDQCILIESSIASHTWCFGFVHAQSTHIPRRELRASICTHTTSPLCIMGDFNVVLGAHERSRVAHNPSRPSQEFRTFLDNAHLHDIDTAGPQFTWVTRRSNHGYMAARLNRVLVNDEFLDLWHTTSETMLPRVSSDHHPIFLRLLTTSEHTIRPFHFQNMWTTHSSFFPMVSASWSLQITARNPIHRVTQKLKRLKLTLKAWNMDTFRNVYMVMEEAAEALTVIQVETAILGDSEERLLTEIDGDRNSKFFHTMNCIRKTSTGLSSLLIDDVLSFDCEAISGKVVNFFSDLFTNQDHDTYDDSVLDSFIQPILDLIDNEKLTCLPSVEEIKTAAFYMEPMSSPGLDGFGVTTCVQNAMTRATGITAGSLPFTCLKVPIFRGAPRTGHLAALTDSIIGKFSKWKGHSLSLAGRKCMTSVLQHGFLDLAQSSSASGRLIDGSRWVVGQSSCINFWNDNWLGYIISERIGIPNDFAAMLTSTIGDYFHDEQ
ncbi:hypothetical protein ACS0TY_023895 [Phlomoides rotata]